MFRDEFEYLEKSPLCMLVHWLSSSSNIMMSCKLCHILFLHREQRAKFMALIHWLQAGQLSYCWKEFCFGMLLMLNLIGWIMTKWLVVNTLYRSRDWESMRVAQAMIFFLSIFNRLKFSCYGDFCLDYVRAIMNSSVHRGRLVVLPAREEGAHTHLESWWHAYQENFPSSKVLCTFLAPRNPPCLSSTSRAELDHSHRLIH